MPVTLTIRNVPDAVVQRLRERAGRHRPSLQDEAMAIIAAAARNERRASPVEILAQVHRRGLRTPSEAAAIVRADRNSR